MTTTNNTPWLREEKDAIVIYVVVSPKAHETKIVGMHDGRLKVKVAAAPEDGKANAELVRFLAGELGLATRSVEVIAGVSSKKKTVKIVGVKKNVIERLI